MTGCVFIPILFKHLLCSDIRSKYITQISLVGLNEVAAPEIVILLYSVYEVYKHTTSKLVCCIVTEI